MAYEIERTPTTMWWNANASDSLAKVVHETDPEFTGLLNHEGKRIMRAKGNIGFIRRSDHS